MAKFEELIKSQFEKFIENYKKDKIEILDLKETIEDLKFKNQMGIEAEFEYLNIDTTGIDINDDNQVISKLNELIEHYEDNKYNEDISNTLNGLKYSVIEVSEQEKRKLDIEEKTKTSFNDTVKLVSNSIENFENKKKLIDEKLEQLKEESKIDKEHENMNYNEIQALEFESDQLEYAIDTGREILSRYDTIDKIDKILETREKEEEIRKKEEERNIINEWLGRDENSSEEEGPATGRPATEDQQQKTQQQEDQQQKTQQQEDQQQEEQQQKDQQQEDQQQEDQQQKTQQQEDQQQEDTATGRPATNEMTKKEELIAKWEKIDELLEDDKKYLMLETLSFTGDELVDLETLGILETKIIKKNDGEYYYLHKGKETPVLDEDGDIALEDLGLTTHGALNRALIISSIAGEFKEDDGLREIAVTKLEEILKNRENEEEQENKGSSTNSNKVKESDNKLPKVEIEFMAKTGTFTVKSEDKKIEKKEFTFKELIEEYSKEFDIDDADNNKMDNAINELLVKVYGEDGFNRLPEWRDKEIAQYLSLHIDLKGVYGKKYDLYTANEIVDWTNEMSNDKEKEAYLTVNKGRVTQFLEKHPRIAKAYNGASRFFDRMGQKLLPAPKEQKQAENSDNNDKPKKELTEHEKFVLSQAAPIPLHERGVISQNKSNNERETMNAEEVNEGSKNAMDRYRKGKGNEK